MKIISTAFIVFGTALAASAQITTIYKNDLKSFKPMFFSGDTNLNKQNFPKLAPLTGGKLANPFVNSLEMNQLMASIGKPNATVVYSRMPVLHLVGTDNMPIARLNATGYAMPNKQITVIDPLKQVLVNP